MPRKDTSLEWTGAEFFVLALLLMQGVEAYKAYVNRAGYDLVAVCGATGRSCRIQVKCRTAKKAPRHFLLDNRDSDVVVHVRLNRGLTDDPWSHENPDVWVFPTGVVAKSIEPSSRLGKVKLSQIPDLETYRSAWHVVRDHLEGHSKT